MFSEDQKIIQRIAPAMQRVLIVDPQPASARMLADILRNYFPCQVWIAPTRAKAVELMQAVMPEVVFIEMAGTEIDGIELTRQLRRSELFCRKVPVIMMTATATAQGILAARDAGVHEFLRKPFTTKDLLRRLEAVVLRSRGWIEAVAYVGPDRRRFNSAEFTGARKRKVDHVQNPQQAAIDQAFKILKSATFALAAEPAQALRSMRAQAADLVAAGKATGDARLGYAAADLQRFLSGIRLISIDNSAEVLIKAGALLKLAPPEMAPAPEKVAA